MDYADYRKAQIQSATPLFRPLEAPAVPPPIALEPEQGGWNMESEDNALVARLLREHIAKQNVSVRQREMKELQSELSAIRAECEALLEICNKPSPPETLLQGAMRSRSGSSA